jgi:hypothetical protein
MPSSTMSAPSSGSTTPRSVLRMSDSVGAGMTSHFTRDWPC